LHCNRMGALVVELFYIAALIVLSIPKEVRKHLWNVFTDGLLLQMELLGTRSFSIIWIWMT